MGHSQYIMIESSKLFSKIFHATTGRLLHEFKVGSKFSCDGWNTAIKISPNEKYMFTMSSKNDGILWRTKMGEKVKKFE